MHNYIMLGIKEKRILYVNSANRLSGTSNAFSIQLNIPAHEQYNKITVLEANIPISYYRAIWI